MVDDAGIEDIKGQDEPEQEPQYPAATGADSTEADADEEDTYTDFRGSVGDDGPRILLPPLRQVRQPPLPRERSRMQRRTL